MDKSPHAAQPSPGEGCVLSLRLGCGAASPAKPHSQNAARSNWAAGTIGGWADWAAARLGRLEQAKAPTLAIRASTNYGGEWGDCGDRASTPCVFAPHLILMHI